MTRALHRLEPTEHMVGTDRTIVISLYDTAGADLSVAGATASWTLYRARPRNRTRPTKGTAVLTKTSAASQITLATGSATVAVADTDLSQKSGDYWQTILITDSGGDVLNQGAGPVLLRAGLS